MRSIVRKTLQVQLLIILVLAVTNVFGFDKPETKRVLQASTAKAESEFIINPERTAVLIMDYENDIIGMLPEATRTPLVEKAGLILQKARQDNICVFRAIPSTIPARYRTLFRRESGQHSDLIASTIPMQSGQCKMRV